MSHEFALQKQREAEQIAQRGGHCFGVKPFFSYAGLFRKNSKKVVVGLAPDGRGKSVHLDQQHRYLERVYEEPEYNSFLDEVWEKNGGEHPKGQAPLQENIRNIFEMLYGLNAEQELRKTPCFNIVPVRALVVKMSHTEQQHALNWGWQVLSHLSPQLVICFSGTSQLRSRLTSMFSSVGAKYVIGKPPELRTELHDLRNLRPDLFE